jgi:hypothetical protein
MGGSDSGRPWSGKCSLDSCIRIDVNSFIRTGLLTPDYGFIMPWKSRHGTLSSCVTVHVDRLILHTSREGIETRQQDVRLVWQRCNYGGQRPWFICPLCSRRVAKLFWWGAFMCRRCTGLKYQSQRVDAATRRIYRAHGLRERLGGTGNSADPFPWKPKRMHWRRYWRLRDKAEHYEQVFMAATMPSLRSERQA